ncbi:putative isomerase [Porphyridium purpureum]|uniref:Putative isomerase n=1 Tax=Porphyridium purpureum TaxID=35688 RepID=A0A5J4YN36_PORPP|nr:putative isomerase [Porphyridium purpureum]|eukprot:POR8064..scf295_9
MARARGAPDCALAGDRITGIMAATVVASMDATVASIDLNAAVSSYIVNAFVIPGRPTSGNPAAVIIVPSHVNFQKVGLKMQQIAAQMGLSETAFVQKTAPPRGEADLPGPGETHALFYSIRWFTPAIEVDLCGHATLAPAAVLLELFPLASTVCFLSRRHGLLTVHAGALPDENTNDSPLGDNRLLWLSFPLSKLQPLTSTQHEADLPVLYRALGVAPEHVLSVLRSEYDLLVELDSASRVVRLRPDMDELSKVQTRGIIVSSLASDTHGHVDSAVQLVADRARVPGFDFVSRFFAPLVGIPEDPVTGSAHTALAAYYDAKLKRPSGEYSAAQMSERHGVITLQVVRESGRVMLGGSAFICVRGEMNSHLVLRPLPAFHLAGKRMADACTLFVGGPVGAASQLAAPGPRAASENRRVCATPSPIVLFARGRGGGKNPEGAMPRGVKKADLPSKICVVCARPFTWRKKWERCWDEVLTCSKRCQGERRNQSRQRTLPHDQLEDEPR